MSDGNRPVVRSILGSEEGSGRKEDAIAFVNEAVDDARVSAVLVVTWSEDDQQIRPFGGVKREQAAFLAACLLSMASEAG